jgi:hypothetical protein
VTDMQAAFLVHMCLPRFMSIMTIFWSVFLS